MNMKFYHGTSKDNWESIQKEGILFGRRYFIDNNGNTKEAERVTYLATEIEEAKCYGDIILQVEYDPYRKEARTNYFDESCWQVRVYEPIPLSNVIKL